MGNNVKPGVLCISLLEHVIGEDWDANIEGTKFSFYTLRIIAGLCVHCVTISIILGVPPMRKVRNGLNIQLENIIVT